MSTIPTYQTQFENWKACVLVPTYNNDQFLETVINDILKFTNHIIIVNDGSTDGTSKTLQVFENQINIFHLDKNSGKGVALHRGFAEARKLGYEYTLTIDSDGQHLASDIPKFFEILDQNPNSLLLGARNMGQENVPGTSSFGHKFSNFWYHVMTGIKMPDTQTGYRMYPLKPMEKMRFFTTKYEFEMEALVRLTWRDITPVPVPINVYYPPGDERVTHFRKGIDFTRISILNTFLVFIGLLWERPKQFFRNLRKKNFRQAWNEYILNTNESNLQLSLAIALGIFIGISPLWGYQIILIIFFAALLKLNKVVALIAGHISIPPMIPFILVGSYKLGGWFLGNATESLNFRDGLSFEEVKDNLLQYVLGAFSLGAIAAVIFGILSFAILSIFRKKKIINSKNKIIK